MNRTHVFLIIRKKRFKIDCFKASLFGMLLDSPVVSFETRHRRFTHSSLHKDVGYYDNELFQSLACMDENFAYLMKKI